MNNILVENIETGELCQLTGTEQNILLFLGAQACLGAHFTLVATGQEQVQYHVDGFCQTALWIKQKPHLANLLWQKTQAKFLTFQVHLSPLEGMDLLLNQAFSQVNPNSLELLEWEHKIVEQIAQEVMPLLAEDAA